MRIISMHRTATCSSTIDHWNDGVLGNVLPMEVSHHSNIPIFQSSSFRILISREHEGRFESRVRIRNEVKTITENQREQQT
jgi:hypothetical protein